jgi:hypothetical protein
MNGQARPAAVAPVGVQRENKAHCVRRPGSLADDGLSFGINQSAGVCCRRRSKIRAWHDFRGASWAGLVGEQDAGAEQVWSGAAVHLSFEAS